MERKPRKDGTVVKHVDLRVSGALVRKIPLRLRNIRERYGSKNATFEYVIDIDEPAKVCVRAADPNECCKLAVAELEKALSIDWRSMFLVSVTGLEYPYYGNREDAKREPHEAKLEVEFKVYEVGVRAGVPVYRQKESGYSHVQEGSPIDRHDNLPGKSCAMVPATDVTRAKLEALVTAVHGLRDRIAELMQPEAVEKTLKDMRVLALPMKTEVATRAEPTKSRTVKPRKAKA